MNFDPENFQQGRYTMNESRLINQIACTYLDAGQGKRAIDIYRQLLGYVEENCRDLLYALAKIVERFGYPDLQPTPVWPASPVFLPLSAADLLWMRGGAEPYC